MLPTSPVGMPKSPVGELLSGKKKGNFFDFKEIERADTAKDDSGCITGSSNMSFDSFSEEL
jgi:hypothetical protein